MSKAPTTIAMEGVQIVSSGPEKSVGERTARELENALAAELRAIETRKKQIAKIQADIDRRGKLVDAIIDEQQKRLDAKRPVKRTEPEAVEFDLDAAARHGE